MCSHVLNFFLQNTIFIVVYEEQGIVCNKLETQFFFLNTIIFIIVCEEQWIV